MSGAMMAAEMAEQPAVLGQLVERFEENRRRVRDAAPDSLAGVAFVARGSSDHAAVFGRYLTELVAGRPAALTAPSLHTAYRADVDYGGYLAVALSQSGATPKPGPSGPGQVDGAVPIRGSAPPGRRPRTPTR